MPENQRQKDPSPQVDLETLNTVRCRNKINNNIRETKKSNDRHEIENDDSCADYLLMMFNEMEGIFTYKILHLT